MTKRANCDKLRLRDATSIKEEIGGRNQEEEIGNLLIHSKEVGKSLDKRINTRNVVSADPDSSIESSREESGIFDDKIGELLASHFLLLNCS